MQKFKKAFVESYVAAIALGWIFSQAILHFAFIFASPVALWMSRREYRQLADRAATEANFHFQDALPELIKSASLLVIGYILLRWLYFKPAQDPDRTAEIG